MRLKGKVKKKKIEVFIVSVNSRKLGKKSKNKKKPFLKVMVIDKKFYGSCIKNFNKKNHNMHVNHKL